MRSNSASSSARLGFAASVNRSRNDCSSDLRCAIARALSRSRTRSSIFLITTCPTPTFRHCDCTMISSCSRCDFARAVAPLDGSIWGCSQGRSEESRIRYEAPWCHRLDQPETLSLTGRFKSLIGRYVSLFGRFVSLFAHLGNLMPQYKKIKDLLGRFCLRNGLKPVACQYLPVDQRSAISAVIGHSSAPAPAGCGRSWPIRPAHVSEPCRWPSAGTTPSR